MTARVSALLDRYGTEAKAVRLQVRASPIRVPVRNLRAWLGRVLHSEANKSGSDMV